MFYGLKRHRETILTTPTPRSGCSKKTTARHDRYMCRNSRTNLHLRSVPTGSFSPMFLWQLGWWIIDFWTLVIWQDDLWRSPYCKKDTDKRDLCGRVGNWTGVMVTGNKLRSVTNPDFCCIVKMVVLERPDKPTSWISSKMIMCSTWIGLLCHRIWTRSRTSGRQSQGDSTTWTTPQQTWLNWPSLLWTSGEFISFNTRINILNMDFSCFLKI